MSVWELHADNSWFTESKKDSLGELTWSFCIPLSVQASKSWNTGNSVKYDACVSKFFMVALKVCSDFMEIQRKIKHVACLRFHLCYFLIASNTQYSAPICLQYESKIFLSNGAFFYPMFANCIHVTNVCSSFRTWIFYQIVPNCWHRMGLKSYDFSKDSKFVFFWKNRWIFRKKFELFNIA